MEVLEVGKRVIDHTDESGVIKKIQTVDGSPQYKIEYEDGDISGWWLPNEVKVNPTKMYEVNLERKIPHRRKIKSEITEEATVKVEAVDAEEAIEIAKDMSQYDLDWVETDNDVYSDEEWNFELTWGLLTATNVDDPSDKAEDEAYGELV